MNILIFDTETTSLEKPFCYNVGYIIHDIEHDIDLVKRDFVIEQVWHNPMLFSTAYYANKRPLYVNAMRARKTIMDKFGYVMSQLRREIAIYNVEHAFAYNSAFDEKVFEFNCEWFHCINPLDTVAIHDIRGHAIKTVTNSDAFREWCRCFNFVTDAGNCSTTAETLYSFISANPHYCEEHTALADSEIECEILTWAVANGAEWTEDYPTPYIKAKDNKSLTIYLNGERFYEFSKVESVRFMNGKTELRIKGE